MTRRIINSIVFLCCLLSLLACATTAALWALSYGGHGDREGDRTSFRTPRGRYAVTSQRGRLVLHGPPPTDPAQGARGARAWELAAGMHNDHITWRRMVSLRDGANASGLFGAGLLREPLGSLWLA